MHNVHDSEEVTIQKANELIDQYQEVIPASPLGDMNVWKQTTYYPSEPVYVAGYDNLDNKAFWWELSQLLELVM